MAGETTITIVGNLTADPEMRFTPQGAAVANFTVASTPRNIEKATGQWVDGDPLFMRCNAWRQMAENAAASLSKGDRVIVTGRLRQRSFETQQGEKRTVVELDVEEMGPSLKWASATPQRPDRSGPGTAAPKQDAPPEDPWSEPHDSRNRNQPQQPRETRREAGRWIGSGEQVAQPGGYDDPPPF